VNSVIQYRRTQRSRWVVAVFTAAAVIPVALLATGSYGPVETGARLTIGAASLALLLSALAFSSLTVVIRDGHLAWWFGPGVVRKTVPLSTIAAVEPTTTALIDGWGIHATARGWLYNVAGRGAVLVTQADGKRFLIGSDEPDRLAQAIRSAARSTGSRLLQE
jgi:hypothetical protein